MKKIDFLNATDFVNTFLSEINSSTSRDLTKHISRTVESKDSSTIEIAVPGYLKTDFRLYLKSGNLYVSTKDDIKETYWKKKFIYKIELDSTFDLNTTDSKLEDGILKITVKRKINETNSDFEIR